MKNENGKFLICKWLPIHKIFFPKHQALLPVDKYLYLFLFIINIEELVGAGLPNGMPIEH